MLELTKASDLKTNQQTSYVLLFAFFVISLFSTFVPDNKVTVDGLVKLSDQDLKDLVPLIGPRNDLKQKIAELYDSGDTNSKRPVFFLFN